MIFLEPAGEVVDLLLFVYEIDAPLVYAPRKTVRRAWGRIFFDGSG